MLLVGIVLTIAADAQIFIGLSVFGAVFIIKGIAIKNDDVVVQEKYQKLDKAVESKDDDIIPRLNAGEDPFDIAEDLAVSRSVDRDSCLIVCASHILDLLESPDVEAQNTGKALLAQQGTFGFSEDRKSFRVCRQHEIRTRVGKRRFGEGSLEIIDRTLSFFKVKDLSGEQVGRLAASAAANIPGLGIASLVVHSVSELGALANSDGYSSGELIWNIPLYAVSGVRIYQESEEDAESVMIVNFLQGEGTGTQVFLGTELDPHFWLARIQLFAVLSGNYLYLSGKGTAGGSLGPPPAKAPVIARKPAAKAPPPKLVRRKPPGT